MGLKSIKKGMKKLKNLPKEIAKKVGEPMMKTFKFFVKFFNMIRKPIMNLVKKVVSGFTFIFFYIKCGIKMLTNFYKCAIFYLLDIFKYIFMYVPVIVILSLIGLGKEIKSVTAKMDKSLQWPNSIQNSCYRCSNKRGEKFALLDTIKAMFEKEGIDDGKFNFFFFLLLVFVGFAFLFTFWHLFFNRRNKI